MKALIAICAAIVAFSPLDELLIVAIVAWTMRRKGTVRS